MRFVRLIAASAALAYLGLTGQAHAAVPVISFTGSFDATYGDALGEAISPPTNIYGKVRAVLTVSQRMEYLALRLHHDYVYDVYDANGYLSWWKGSRYYVEGWGSPFPARKAAVLTQFIPLTITHYADETVYYADTLSYIELDAWAPDFPKSGFSPGPVGWRVDLYAEGVPEPATWALLILGFGAVGAMMRRPGVRHRRTSRQYSSFNI